MMVLEVDRGSRQMIGQVDWIRKVPVLYKTITVEFEFRLL